MSVRAKRHSSRILLWILLALCFFAAGPHDLIHDCEEAGGCAVSSQVWLEVPAPLPSWEVFTDGELVVSGARTCLEERFVGVVGPRAPPA